jgi:hypothetical protein
VGCGQGDVGEIHSETPRKGPPKGGTGSGLLPSGPAPPPAGMCTEAAAAGVTL